MSNPISKKIWWIIKKNNRHNYTNKKKINKGNNFHSVYANRLEPYIYLWYCKRIPQFLKAFFRIKINQAIKIKETTKKMTILKNSMNNHLAKIKKKSNKYRPI